MKLVYRPKHAMNLYCLLNRERAEAAITRKKNATRVTLRKGERKSVVYRQRGNLPSDGQLD